MDEALISDGELVFRFLNGSVESFQDIIARYETKVFNTALYLTNDSEGAEDVLHRVFLDLFERLQNDFGKTPLFSWLLQHTLDTALQHLLQSCKQDNEEIHNPVLDQPFSAHQERFESRNCALRAALGQATACLSEDARYVFVLRDIQGLPLNEVAEALDMSIFEARAKLHRARLRIRRELSSILRNERLKPKMAI